MSKKLLLVEDDGPLRDTIRSLLLDEGFGVDVADTGAAGIKQATEQLPDLMILDLGLPDVAGETVFREVRKQVPELPIIILTARNTPRDVVRGLNLGADDYIPKPFDGDELIARIHARLRQSLSATIAVADLVLDREKVKVKRGNKEIVLTQREFRLLEFLMANTDRVFSRDVILQKVWGYAASVESRAVDVYIGYLRKKVDSGFPVKLIHSVPGFGYVLREPDSKSTKE